MKRWIAGLVTLGLLVAALVLGRRASVPQADAGASSPEACIQRMFDAARLGDVAAYLDCFTGQERRRLDQQLAGGSEEAFARSLVEAVATLKGRAVFAAGGSDATDGRRILTVDRVYASRMERQRYHLVLESGTWRIEAVESANAFQPYKPYGTPVYEPELSREKQEP